MNIAFIAGGVGVHVISFPLILVLEAPSWLALIVLVSLSTFTVMAQKNRLRPFRIRITAELGHVRMVTFFVGWRFNAISIPFDYIEWQGPSAVLHRASNQVRLDIGPDMNGAGSTLSVVSDGKEQDMNLSEPPDHVSDELHRAFDMPKKVE